MHNLGVTSAARKILIALRRLGLEPMGQPERLAGGVSSDVYRVELSEGPVCVKRALARLRVAADWRAPVERSHSEVLWLRAVETIPGIVAPTVTAEDPAAHLFVMTWFEPSEHPVWKTELADGRIDPGFAGKVGAALAAVHAATAARPQMATDFANDDMFYDLRLEPYLLHAATRHPDLADALHALSKRTLERRVALVHGDISPKNILVGPGAPIFLDAECAWWGDPAFDLAFCLNHLLLKCVWRPSGARDFLAAFEALRTAYLAGVDFEPRVDLERRATELLAGLLLARVDGKSPVEYLTEARDQEFVRAAARDFISRKDLNLMSLAGQWAQRLQTR
ncbi:MAG: phosphotransferase family protein [Caulobacteraceae bacterium]